MAALGGRETLARRSGRHAALHLAAEALASLAGLALALDGRLLVEAAALQLLQDALLGHLLLQDLHRLLEAVANLDLDGLSKRAFHGGHSGYPIRPRRSSSAYRYDPLASADLA